MAEAKAEAQESSSPRCLLLLAGGLPSSVSGTILLTGACKPLSYGTRLRHQYIQHCKTDTGRCITRYAFTRTPKLSPGRPILILA